MKAVLISIQPHWCEMIATGEKTLEVRKTMPKMETPFKCYIYCTLSGSNEFFKYALNGDVAAWNRGKWGERKGNVIGEFICDNIMCFDVPYPAFQSKMDKRIIEESCCTYWQLHRYAYHDALYGWHISDLVIYDKPKDLCEFYKVGTLNASDWEYQLYDGSGDPSRRSYASYLFTRAMRKPPQSWCYVAEFRFCGGTIRGSYRK